MDTMATWGRSPLLPIFFFFVDSLVFIWAIGLPRRKRVFVAPALLGPAVASFWTAPNLRWPPGLDSLWSLSLLVHILRVIAVLYFEKEERLRPSSILARIRVWQDYQGLGSRLETQTKPSRARTVFFLSRLATLLTYWLTFNYIIWTIFPARFLPMDVDEFSPARGPLVRRLLNPKSTNSVTLQQISLRASLTIYWLFSTVAMIDGFNIMLSLAFVAIGLNEPSDWPPIFGNPIEAYSVRRFWSRFWHHMVVPTYCCHFRAFAQTVLGIEPSPALMAFGVFAISGASHAFSSWRGGDRCGWSDDIWFYLLNFAVAAGEVLMEKRWRALNVRPLRSQSVAVSIVRRVLGYLWVLVFFVWIVPKWQYPKFYCDIQDNLARAGHGQW